MDVLRKNSWRCVIEWGYFKMQCNALSPVLLSDPELDSLVPAPASISIPELVSTPELDQYQLYQQIPRENLIQH
jgi:hypothetical protein